MLKCTKEFAPDWVIRYRINGDQPRVMLTTDKATQAFIDLLKQTWHPKKKENIVGYDENQTQINQMWDEIKGEFLRREIGELQTSRGVDTIYPNIGYIEIRKLTGPAWWQADLFQTFQFWAWLISMPVAFMSGLILKSF
jgi:hypothetical protein